MDREDVSIQSRKEKPLEFDCMMDSNDHETEIDVALALSGPFGKFQILVQLFFMYVIVTIGFQTMITYFLADDPPWTCANNVTSAFCIENIGKHITITNSNFSARCTMKRNEWIYTRPATYSYVTEFDLVCKNTSVVFSS